MASDSHCHLDFFEHADITLNQARTQGIRRFICPGTTLERFQAIATLAINYTNVYPAYGLHPWFSHPDDAITQLETWLQNHHAVAIGECGLDKHRPTQQHQLFNDQIALAKERQLPLIIHSVGTHEHVLKHLKQAKIKRAVFHGFYGSVEQARTITRHGYYLGIGAMLLRPSAHKLRTILQTIPLCSLLLESDAPDGCPDFQCFTNIAQSIAEIQNIDYDTVINTTDHNTTELFQLHEFIRAH
jgi:TatD DNase family protein